MRRDITGVSTQTHGPALVSDALLVGHQVNDRMGGGCQFTGMSIGQTGHMAGELHHRHLHPQADAEEGDLVFPGILGSPDHPFDAPVAEAAGHQDPRPRL